MKRLALNLLAWLSGRVAAKYKVKIVAVTGSVGKTTAKEAIFAVLSQVYDAQRSLQNVNTEWGIAASVISPGFEPTFTASGKAKISLVQFCSLIWQAKLKLWFRRPYPTVLVLELAADRPGDIRWFNRWFKYDVAVITTIGSTHLDYYRDQSQLTAEKLSIMDGLKSLGLAVVNGECDQCQNFIQSTQRRKVTFGMNQDFDYSATVITGKTELHHGDHSMLVALPSGRQHVPAALMAWAVGEEFGLNLDQIKAGLESIQPVDGRFQIHRLPRWTVVDDTYNAAPESMRMALVSLNDLAHRRRVAILGEMRELGDQTQAKHQELGAMAAKLTDLLIAMGPAGKLIAQGAIAAGMSPVNVVTLEWDPNHPRVDETISQLLPILQDNDSVLVKASRTIYLDKLVKKLLVS